MREQLEALEELARIDLGFRQLDVEMDELTSHLADLRNDVDRIRDLLDREKAQLAEVERLRVSTVQEIEDIVARMARSTSRNSAAKNNREREATAREMEVSRREKEERTAKVADLEKAVVEVRASLVRHEEDFLKLQALLGSEESEGKTKADEIAVRRTAQDDIRKGVLGKVRGDLLRKYNSIRERKGTAVAEISGGICRACHIAIPPQLVAKLHNGGEIYQCPNCQRILMLRPTGSGA